MPDLATSQIRTSERGLRLGIRCDHSKPGWSSDPAIHTYLKELLQALADGDSPSEVMLLTNAAHREHDWDIPKSLGVEIISHSTDWTWLLRRSRILCSCWLRWSNRLLDWSLALESASDEVREYLARRLRSKSMGLVFVLLVIALASIWLMYLLWRLLAAVLWGLGFPLWMADRVIRRFEFWLRRRENEPILAADCDLWIVPFPQRWSLEDVPAVLLFAHAGQLKASRLPQPGQGVHNQDLPCGHACVTVTLDCSLPGPWFLRWLGLPAERVRAAPRGLDQARDWRSLFEEVINLAPTRRGLDHVLLAPWPVKLPAHPRGPLEVFLFLQIPWGGGNWEHTRDLVAALSDITARDGRLRLSLGLHATQPGAWMLESTTPSIPVHRFHFNALSRAEAACMSEEAGRRLARTDSSRFCFFSGAAEAALQAGAWFALSDRFPLPLLPARPYGVVVHDMIHRHVPEALGRGFFRNLEAGIIPTIQQAARIVTTSPCTRDDVLAGYDLPPHRVELIPVACEPHRRFAGLPTGFVPLPRREFILNVTNASPHKGADVMLRAYASLKRRLGASTPLLVLCGVNTEYLAPSQGRTGHPFWSRVRVLQHELHLRENHDLVFLGTVTDPELKDLYERCRVVVNAARHDNGTYCLIEGAWFGQPVLSTRYPAAEFLAERFGLPVSFVPINDDEAMAETLAESLRTGPASPEKLTQQREQLMAPEFSIHHYAARLYPLLLELAAEGRRERLESPLHQADNHLCRLAG